MTGLQLTSEVVVRITDASGVDALDGSAPRIDFLAAHQLGCGLQR